MLMLVSKCEPALTAGSNENEYLNQWSSKLTTHCHINLCSGVLFWRTGEGGKEFFSTFFTEKRTPDRS